MERFPLERALDFYKRESPYLAARAETALNQLLTGVSASSWPQVAWRFSNLTGDGYPIELAFTSTDEVIRYVVEVAGPETDPADRLELALALIAELGGGDKTDLHWNLEVERLRKIQYAGALDYGTWVSGRHGPKGDAFKLYVEVPKGESPAANDWVRHFLGSRPLLLGRSTVLRMIGLEVATGRVEFYFRAHGMESWEVARLMGLFDLTAQVDDLLGLVEDITERSTAQHLPSAQTGFSLSVGPKGVPTVFSLFFLARSLLGGDGKIRRRLLDAAGRHSWPLRHYATISAPLAEREGLRTRHGMLSFVAAPGTQPLLHVGLRPP